MSWKGRRRRLVADVLGAEAAEEDKAWAWRQLRESEWGHPFGAVMGGVSTPLNTEELAIVMNLPRHEIPGVSVRQTVPFGMNYIPPSDKEAFVPLGRVLFKHSSPSDTVYEIPEPLFKKHIFVCGVTGSGKTNTCIRLLRGLRKPFMVIEPAKNEYRQMLAEDRELKVFTLGDERCSPFRINPFSFFYGGNLLAHVDSLKAVFNSAFPMYAAMPYILEEAILEVYLDKGWNLVDSTNRFMKGEQDPDFDYYLPTMKDLYRKIEEVVQRKRYAEEASTNYRASLQARVSSLMVGSKGAMLNTRHSTPLEELLRNKVVLELKNLGDDEEKCFIMGLILSSVYEYRENRGRLGEDLQHILLIEEAHRLLKRTPDYVSPEVGNSRGKAVESFANMLAEVREYGQGIVITDQIPTKLASDVIKNTNMKIVHRTLAQDDRLCVGETMNLNEAQTKELALLPVGEAVVCREGMEKAFRVQVDLAARGKGQISDEDCREKMATFHEGRRRVYAPCITCGAMEADWRLSKIMHDPSLEDYDDTIRLALASVLYVMLRGKKMDFDRAKQNFTKTVQEYLKKEAKKGHLKNEVEEAVVSAYAARCANDFWSEWEKWLSYDRILELNRIFFTLWCGESLTEEASRILKDLSSGTDAPKAVLHSGMSQARRLDLEGKMENLKGLDITTNEGAKAYIKGLDEFFERTADDFLRKMETAPNLKMRLKKDLAEVVCLSRSTISHYKEYLDGVADGSIMRKG